MKKSKFSEAQIAFILCQADEGTPVAEVCRKAGISDATFYNWRTRVAAAFEQTMCEDVANGRPMITSLVIGRAGNMPRQRCGLQNYRTARTWLIVSL